MRDRKSRSGGLRLDGFGNRAGRRPGRLPSRRPRSFQAALDKGLQSIEKNLQRMVDKGTLPAADRDQVRGRLSGTTASQT